MVEQQKSYSSLVFVLLIFYFVVWGVVKPPYQAPDEFAHHIKALSVLNHTWIAPDAKVKVNKKLENPLLSFRPFHTIPFRTERPLLAEELKAAKATEWYETDGSTTVKIHTQAFSYPNLYYFAVFLIGEGTTKLLSLNPYESFYAYRFGSIILAALLWLLVFLEISKISEIQDYRVPVFLLIICNPMLAFISSSINADAVLNPLSALLMLSAYNLIVHNRSALKTCILLLLVLFTKPTALFFVPTILFIALLTWVYRFYRKEPGHSKIITRVLPLVILTSLVGYLSFYAYSPTTLSGSPLDLTLVQYFQDLVKRVPHFFVRFWGVLGWTDYHLAVEMYYLLAVILALNIFVFFYSNKNLNKNVFLLYLFVFSLIYSFGLLAGEFINLKVNGYIFQGRYLLPVALGFSVFIAHNIKFLRWAFIGYLILFNLLFLEASIERYYKRDYSLFISSLPFSSAPTSSTEQVVLP